MNKSIFSPDPQVLYDALIVGAGLSGLTLADRLSGQGRPFLILEKSGGVGGRVATRRDDSYFYDHGAQFYKISDQHKLPYDSQWEKAGLVSCWFTDEGVDRKISPTGLTSIAKSLAQEKPIVLKEEVSSLRVEENVVKVGCLNGTVYRARKVYITAPVPQAISLLNKSEFAVPDAIKKIEYASALIGLFELQNLTNENLFRYEERISDSLFSISRQNSKFKANPLTYTVVMNSNWSREHFNLENDLLLDLIENLFLNYLHDRYMNEKFHVVKKQLKKWRFSHPLNPLSCNYYEINDYICLLGDGFAGASINAAVQSGLSTPLE
jgi:renalase